MKRLALAALLAFGACATLGACGSVRTVIVEQDDLAPIPKDYRQTIVAWARQHLAEPQGIRAAAISQPVPVRDRTGRIAWLVCVQLDTRAKDGGYMGLQHLAFGFNGTTVSAPIERGANAISKLDCEELPLAYRPWPELERL